MLSENATEQILEIINNELIEKSKNSNRHITGFTMTIDADAETEPRVNFALKYFLYSNKDLMEVQK